MSIHPQVDAMAFVVKVTERCNLSCTYCYFFFGGDDSYQQHPPVMSMDSIDELAKFIRDATEHNGLRSAHVGFHGGEPLLMNKKRLSDACRRLRVLDANCRLDLRVQTNGVLIDDEWIAIFAEHDVYVGVSFDGAQAIHDAHRVTKTGKGSYAKARRGWDLLRAAARSKRIREPGILCVIDPRIDGGEIFDHFISDLGARLMDFLLPDVTHDKLEMDAEFVRGCGDYLVAVCQRWFALGASDINVRFIDHVVGPLLNDDLMRSSASTKNDPLSILTISSDGTIGPDDTIRILDPRFRSSLPRLGEHRLSDVLRHDVWQELGRSRVLAPSCRSCKWVGVCRGGNRVHRFAPHTGFDNPSGYCGSLLRMYEYVASRLVLGGFPQGLINNRLRTFGDQRMASTELDGLLSSTA